MKRILDKLSCNQAVQALIRDEDTLGNLNPIEEALLLAATYEKKKNKMLIVKSNQYTAQKLVQRLIPLTEAKVLLFSVEESLRVEAIASSPEQKANQLEALNMMLDNDVDIVVTHVAAFIRYMPSIQQFQKCCIQLEVNQEIVLDELKERLFYAGYEFVTRVDTPLTYASRGGIIDVFSINQENPIRIEFFDNEIESIRYFDVTTQRTIQTIDQVKIIPATDLLFSDEDIENIITKGNERLEKTKNKYTSLVQETYLATINEDFDGIANHQKENHYYRYFTLCNHETTIHDYFDATIYLSNVDEVNNKIKSINEETIAYIQELVSIGKALPIYTHFANLEKAIGKQKTVEFQSFVNAKTPIMSGIKEMDIPDVPLEIKLQKSIEEAKQNCVLFCVNETESNLLIQSFLNLNQKVNILNENDSLTEGLHIMIYELSEGFSCANENLYVYSSKELFNTKKIIGKFRNKFNKAITLTSYEQLQKGDYVVHEQHGI
ncbi:MAG: transcription-repair coupling factor, partial [Traorella sp.]